MIHDDEFSPKLEAAFIEACPGAEVLDCGLFSRKTELRLSCKFSNGDGASFFRRGRIEPEQALSIVRDWGIKKQIERQKAASHG